MCRLMRKAIKIVGSQNLKHRAACVAGREVFGVDVIANADELTES